MPRSDITLMEFFLTVYWPLRLQPRCTGSSSGNTKRLYQYSIRLLEETIGRFPRLSDLENDLLIAKHLTRLQKLERSPYSIAKERSQLLAIANLAKKRGYIDCAFEVVAPVLPRRAPRAWLPDEIYRLMAAIDRAEGEFAGVPKKRWWKALHLVLWDTGGRISELLAIEWDWIEGRWLSIPASARKGKRGDMSYHLRPETVEAIEDIRAPCRVRVFAWPYAITSLYYNYAKLLRSAGLEDDQGKFHRMRKTVASHYKAAGHDPQRLLDHADARTTAKYIDPRIAPRIEACDVLPPINHKAE